ncbi:MAG: lipid-A-disaccharide synthase [Muribaculaceae bacterium]|nr:lipid-A-disaccharide synthase [Bacteroidales bacterium]MBR0493264.1 lipid-A-disaccharide synthase [Muribaculaceae bacterium]
MKYFLIAGEASGDLHASHLIESLKQLDPEAQFRFLGGDMMSAQAGTQPIIHYRDMAYMGFADVVRHLGKILGFLGTARRSIDEWQPAAVILVDYPSFNLKVAKYAHNLGIPVHYFISPKVWVWKEWRVKDIRRYVNHMYCILPFEPDWYRERDYKATYVGNPTVQEVAQASKNFPDFAQFIEEFGLPDKPIIALVPGSRVREIRDNLPLMLEAAARHPEYQAVIAGAPSIDDSLYRDVMGNQAVPVLRDATYPLVHHARAAIVTSGTATLETALLGTPQVACYRFNGSKLSYNFYRRLLTGKYVTLPNLIVDEPVIPELLMHLCTVDSIDSHLSQLLADSAERTTMLGGYQRLAERLGTDVCTETAARLIKDSMHTIS